MKRPQGRGTQSNASSRFHQHHVVSDPEILEALRAEEELLPLLRTEFLPDNTKTIINENRSPDLPFRYSLNSYRGCEHGCAYCYARPTHEFLGFSAGLDFESKIFVKENAPELLRERLLSAHWEPDSIFMSGVTDCYQPAERKFQITRKVLQVLAEFRNPVGIITKNFLVTRDIDLLQELAKFQAVHVTLSVTTLDNDLARVLEPRTSAPTARLKAIELLAKAGIPVSVNIAPVVPGLTDHEMPKILEAAAFAGAKGAGFQPVRLPYSVKEIFSKWMLEHRPERRNKVLNAICSTHEGELDNSEFHKRMRGSGPRAEQLQQIFSVFSRKYGLNENRSELSAKHFQRPGEQLQLF